jgi:hypothetical protein
MWRFALLCGFGSLIIGSGVLAEETSDLPGDAQALVERCNIEAELIQKEADLRILQKKYETAKALRQLQEKYTKEGRLDEAVAIRDRIRDLLDRALPVDVTVLPDPGRPYNYTAGQTVYFQVTGRTDGSVWGTDNYTTDSTLATAAVHAGAVKAGETRVVKVSVLPGATAYVGSTRHGVTTYSYGSYSTSFKVEKTNYRVNPNLAQPGTAGFPSPVYTDYGTIYALPPEGRHR